MATSSRLSRSCTPRWSGVGDGEDCGSGSRVRPDTVLLRPVRSSRPRSNGADALAIMTSSSMTSGRGTAG